MSACRLIHTGSVIVDIVMGIDRLPDPGGDTIAHGTQLVAGGGLNTIVAARRDGLDVLYAGLRGTGPFGSVVARALADARVTEAFPPREDSDSGFCVALVDGDAERTFVTHLGAEGELSEADLRRLSVRAGDIVYVTGYSLATAGNADGLAAWLPELPSEVTVLVDPSPLVGELEPRLFEPLFARADILSCNAREARILTGEEDLSAAARILTGRVRAEATVVVRDGGNGCRIVRRTENGIEEVIVPSYPVDAIDTNGAGDAHAGVLMAGIARGLPMVEAVRRANAAAAIAVTREGPATSPEAAEIDAFLAGGRAVLTSSM